jgi:hypothetical protein
MKKYFTHDEIENYLWENRDDLYVVNHIRTKVSPEDYEVLKALGRKCNSSAARAGARHRQWDWDLRMWILWRMWRKQDGKCAVTGMPMSPAKGTWSIKNPWAISIDRIDHNEGYTIGNTRLVTHWYNNAKNTWTDEICTEAFNHWRSKAND